MRYLLRPDVRLALLALWCCAWLGVGALLLLPIHAPGPFRSDLLAHALLFFGMAFTGLGFCRRPIDLVGLTLLTLLGSTALEWAQRLIPYRSFDLLDGIANAVGATFGCVAAIPVLMFVIRPALDAAEESEAQAETVLFSIGPRGAPPKM